MTQTPQTPAGWYPQGHQERWWDGTQWSDNFRPIQTPTVGTPTTSAYGATPTYGTPQTYLPQQPVKQSHWARNCLIVFAIFCVLGIGGCAAAVFLVKNKVDDVVNDQTPGGPNVALTITPGKAFSVKHFDYSDGWTVGPDAAGDAAVTKLQLTNNRNKADFVFVHIDLRQGSTILATINCTLPNGARIGKGDKVTLTCVSSDPMPQSYDRVTINDDI